MATALQTLIDAYIKRNANQEITGPVLNGVLSAIADALNTPFIGEDGYWYTYDPETGQFVQTDTPAQGETGPVGVTEAAATIDANIGTPSVAVSLNGTRLDFAFRNLKGETGNPGITAATVTVDNNEGTPSVDASIEGTTLNLAFHNLKGTTFTTEPDDLTLENAVLKFADRSADTNQMGYKILRRGTTFASQVTDTNTIYEIRYDFDLNNGTVTIPAGCVLKFNGGMLSNGTLNGTNTGIIAGIVKIFDLTTTLSGSWKASESFPEWFGAVGDGTTDDTNAVKKALSVGSFRTIVISRLYNITSTITISGNKIFLGTGNARNKSVGFVSTSFTNDESGMIEINQDSALSLKHIYFNGGYKCAYGVKETNSAYLNFDDCYFERFYRAGILYSASDSLQILNTYVRYCHVGLLITSREPDYTDILVFDDTDTPYGSPNHILVKNCSFLSNNFGCVCKGSTDISIENCLFGWNDLFPLAINNCKNVRVTGMYSEGDFRGQYLIEKDMADDPRNNTRTTMLPELQTLLTNNASVTSGWRSLILLAGTRASICGLYVTCNYIREYVGVSYNDETERANALGFDTEVYVLNGSCFHESTTEISNMTVGGVTVLPKYQVAHFGSGRTTTTSVLLYSPGRVAGNSSAYYNTGTSKPQISNHSFTGCEQIVEPREWKRANNSLAINSYSPSLFASNVPVSKIVRGDVYRTISSTHYMNTVVPVAELKEQSYRINIKFYKTSGASINIGYKIYGYNAADTSFTLLRSTSVSKSLLASELNTPMSYYEYLNLHEVDGWDYVMIELANSSSNTSYTSITLTQIGEDDPKFMTFGKEIVTPLETEVGFRYFDMTNGKPIFWNGSGWVDATGLAVV